VALNFNLMGLGFHFFVKDDATLGLERIDRAMKNITADAEEMYYKTKASLDQIQPKLGALGDERVQAALRNTGLALMGVGTAGLAAAGFAVKSFGDFEQQMLNARSVAQWTEEQFKDLSKYAIKVGADTKFSAREVAEAMYEIASAGVSAAEDVKALLRPIADFAAAGAIQMPEATRAIVAAIQGFRLQMSDAAHVADVFTAAIQNSMLKANEFDAALGSVAGVAGQVGQSLEAALAGLMAARNVIGSAQDAATSMKSALMSLIAPTSEASNIMNVLGIKLRDAQGNMKPWPQIIREFELSFAAAGKLVNQFASFAGASDDQLKGLAQAYGLTKDQALGLTQAAAQGTKAFQDYVLATIFGTDGIRAVAAGLNAQAKAMIDGREVTLRGANALEYWQKKLEGSAGAAQNAAEVQMSGLNGAMEQLRGSIEAVGLTIGNTLAPTFKAIAGIIERGVDIFNRMPEGLQKTAAWVLVGGSALALFGGAVLLGISLIPSFVQGLVALRTGMLATELATWGARAAALAHAGAMMVVRVATLAWAGAQWVLNAALSANPIGLVIAAIAGLATGIYFLLRHWEKVKAVIADWWGKLTGWFSGLPAWGKYLLAAFLPVIGVPLLIAEHWDKIKTAVKGAWDRVVGTFEGAKTKLLEKWDSLKRFFTWDNLLQGLYNIGETAGRLVAPVYNFFKDIWSKITEKLKELTSGGIEGILVKLYSYLLNAPLESLDQIPEVVWNKITAAGKRLVEGLTGWIKATWEWGQQVRKQVSNTFTEWYEAVVDWGRETKKRIISTVTSWVDTIVTWFKELPGRTVTAIREWGQGIATSLRQALQNAREALSNWAAGVREWPGKVAEGLRSGFQNIIAWFKELPNRIVESVRSWASRLGTDVKPVGQEVGRSLAEAIPEGFTKIDLSKVGKYLVIGLAAIIIGLPATLALGIVRVGQDIVNWLAGAISQKLAEWGPVVVDWFAKTWDGVRQAAVNTWELVRVSVGAFLSGIVNAIVSRATELWQAAYQAGSNIVRGMVDTIAGLPGKVLEILQQVINTISSKVNDFWSAARTAASNLWEGFKAGLGIHSPSYIERALTSIMEVSQATVMQLSADFRRLSSLSAEPQVKMAVAYSFPAPAAPVAPVSVGTLATPPVIVTRVKQERSEVASAATPQVVTRQPVKLVLDGRVIAETVIEFIEDMQARRVVPA